MINYIILAVFLAVAAAGYFWWKSLVRSIQAVEKPTVSLKRKKRFAVFLLIIGIWVSSAQLLGLIFGKAKTGGLTLSIAAPRVDFLGFSLSTTVIWSWVIIVALVFLALILRLTLIPRMKDVPSSKGQNLLELAVETIEKYTKETAGGTGELLASYIFTITVFLVGCAVLELFGVRSPASDITLTGALAIVTFILINVYGLRRKGVAGRVKSLASPTPIILPIRIVTDLALPISLACRLFGNMLGGLVVMDLLYSALGDYAVGIPSLAGLYFNVFHPLIQTFIFITLTLTFINEAIE